MAKRADDLRGLTLDIKRVSRMRAWFAHMNGDLEQGAKEGLARLDEPSLWLTGLDHRPVLVGPPQQAGLVVIDETVSRLHPQIVRTPDGFILTDIASTNGTWMRRTTRRADRGCAWRRCLPRPGCRCICCDLTAVFIEAQEPLCRHPLVAGQPLTQQP